MNSGTVKQIVSEAFDLEPDQRDAFVRKACGRDQSLLAEVLSLLDAASNASDASFLPTRDHAVADDLSHAPDGNGKAVATAQQVLEAPEQFGRYKVLERIGEGGMGIVYRAEQRVPMRREVVVKVIKLGMDTKLVIARFEAERQALAMMDHPHIAKVYDAGTDDRGRPYFVMEYVKGTPILDYCDRNHLDVRQRLELFTQVCQAIQHAHHKGIIHRDIKPSNILVSTQDGKPFAKVIDFGIAKATNQRLTDRTLFTEHVNMIGTPAYMSPEQADGNIDIDTRTDVYSLGVVLYELLTGRTPFDSRRLKSAALNEIARIIREEDPPKPSTRMSTMNTRPTPSGSSNKDQAGDGLDNAQTLATLAKARSSSPEVYGKSLQGEIDWMVMKAIEKDRARRYDTPNAMAEDIERFLKGEAVLAAPPTLRYRIGKFAFRYKTPIAATAVIAILLIGGILLSAWLALRARAAEKTVAEQLIEVQRQKDTAQRERDEAHDANQRAAESEKHAIEEATGAKLLAHYVGAQYMLSQGRLAPAFAEISLAINTRPRWEYGFLLSSIVETSRESWLPVGRFADQSDASTRSCFCGPDGQILAEVTGRQMKLFQIRTGQQLCDLDLGGPSKMMTPCGASAIAVADTNGVTIYPVSNPTEYRSLALDKTPICFCSDPDGKHIAVICDGWNTLVIDTQTMSVVAQHRPPFGRFQISAGAVGQPTIQFSPTGRLVLLNSAIWTQPLYLWDWTSDKLMKKSLGHSNYYAFADDETLVGLWRWDNALSEMDLPVSKLGSSEVTNHYFSTRSADNLQAWHPAVNSPGISATDLLASATSDNSIEIFSVGDGRLLASDRFNSLFPTEATNPRYLAFDPRSGFLALADENAVDVLQFTKTGPGAFGMRNSVTRNMRFWSVTAGSDAMYYASERGVAHEKLTIVRTGFTDGTRKSADCDWPDADKDKVADVWGIGVTPDGKQLAALWQENSGGGNISSDFFRKKILIYRLDPNLDPAHPPQLERQIPLNDYTGLNGRDNRIVRLSPDGKSVVFVPSSGQARIYSVIDGHPLARFSAGTSFCSSPDGSLVAGGNFAVDAPINVWRIDTGEKILTTSAAGKIRKMAITNDNKKLYVGWDSETMECLEIPSGKSLSKLSTKLVPVAISPTEDRFAAFLPDSAVHGSMVLASLSTGQVIQVLNDGMHILNTAYFSPTGNSIATMIDRDIPAMFQSLTIDQANTALNRMFPPISPRAAATQPDDN